MTSEPGPAISPFVDFLGIGPVTVGEDSAFVSLVLRPEHRNIHGRPHGGLIATLMDTVSGFAVQGDLQAAPVRRAVTVSLVVHFIGAAKGEHLEATARVVRRGNRLCYTTIEVTDGTGTVVAFGDAIWQYVA